VALFVGLIQVACNMHYVVCGYMYQNRNSARIEEKIQNGRLFKNLPEEKNT
jgi:hypothetical protein